MYFYILDRLGSWKGLCFACAEERQKNRVLSKLLPVPSPVTDLHMRSAGVQGVWHRGWLHVWWGNYGLKANGRAVYNNLGYHWATSLLAFLTLAMLPFP